MNTAVAQVPRTLIADDQPDVRPRSEGDKLVLFTDGVTEARNPAGEEFGEQRLEGCLRLYAGRNAAALRTMVLDEVTEFCSDNFDDDAALMVVIAE